MGHEGRFLVTARKNGRIMDVLLYLASERRGASKKCDAKCITNELDLFATLFGGGSETGRDVANEYIESKQNSLPPHEFLKYTKGSKEYEALPKSLPEAPSCFLFELFVDDYICTVIPRSQEQLDYCANATTHVIHDVFVENFNADEDPILLKKAKKGDWQWRAKNEVLGFDIDGNPGKHTMVLAKYKRHELLEFFKSWLRLAKLGKGVHWEEFESRVAKL